MARPLWKLASIGAAGCTALASLALIVAPAAAAADPRDAVPAGSNGSAAACATPGPGVSVCGESYGSDDYQTLDYYLPASQTKRAPVVLVIHGGGWQIGNTASMADEAIYFAENGLAAFAIDHRRSAPDDPGSPKAFDDVQSAVAWITAHARELRVDPTRLGAFGLSSGGHLAALLNTAGEDTEGGYEVRSTVTLSSPFDLSAAYKQSANTNEQIELFLGCAPVPDDLACTELAAEASPITHVDETDGPMLMFNSAEEFMPYEQAASMATALTDAGVEHELVKVKGRAHAGKYECKTVTVDGETLDVIDASVTWLGRDLIGPGFLRVSALPRCA